MPTPPPVDTGKKRSHQDLDLSLPPAKRARFISPVDFPTVPVDTGTSINKILHIPLLTHATQGLVDYIKVWSLMNPEYEVIVWRDQDNLLINLLRDKEILLKNELYVYQEGLERDNRFVGRPALDQEYESVLRADQRRIDEFIDSGLTWKESVRKLLKEEVRVPESEIKSYEDKLENLYAQLNGFNSDGDNIGVIVRDVSQLLERGDRDELSQTARQRLYNDLRDLNFSLRPNRSLIQTLALYDYGGITVNPKSQPRINRMVFDALDVSALDALDDDDKILFERAKSQIVLEKFLDENGLLDEYQQYIGEFEDYPNPKAILQRTHPELVRQLESAVADAIINDAGNPLRANGKGLLLRLGTLDAGPTGIMLSNDPQGSVIKPLAMASSKGNPALLEVQLDMRVTADRVQSVGRARTEVDPHFQNEWLSQIRDDIASRFAVDFSGTGSEGRATLYTRGILNLLREGYFHGTDAPGDLFGHEAVRRNILKSFREQGMGGETALPALAETNYRTPEFQAQSLSEINKRLLLNFERDLHYRNQIIITFQDDGTIYGNALADFEKAPGRSYWVYWDQKQKKFFGIDGTEVRPDEKTRVIVGGHGSPPGETSEGSVGLLNSDESAFVISEVLGRNIRVGVLSVCACSSEDMDLFSVGRGNKRFLTEGELSRSWGAQVLLKLKNKYQITVGKLTARISNLITGIDARKWVLAEFLDGSRFWVHKSPDRILEFELTKDSEGKDAVRYQKKTPKSGTRPPLDDNPSSVIRPASFDGQGVGSDALDSYLAEPQIAQDSMDFEPYIERLTGDLNQKEILVSADPSAVVLAMADANATGRIMVADQNQFRLAAIQKVLELARDTRSADGWIEAVHDIFPHDSDSFSRALSRFGDRDIRFQNLRQRVLNHEVRYANFDPASVAGSTFIPRPEDGNYGAIHIDTVGSPSCSGTRRRRSACSPDEIDEQARETVDGLTLLSDDETRILVGNSPDDIALHTTEPDSALAKVQKGIHDFRRSSTSQRIADHEGYHTIIVLDSDDSSKSAATALAQNGNEETRVLSFQRDGRGNPVLLTEDGRVVTMVEGGSRNRVSLVGTTDTFADYSSGDMASGVRALVQGETVASVTVHPVLEAGEDFSLSAFFSELDVTERNSPWRDTAKVIRLHALQDEGGKVLETNTMQVGEPGVRDSYFLDGQHVRETFGINPSRLPGKLQDSHKLV